MITGEGVLHFLRTDFRDYLQVGPALRIEGIDYMVRRSSDSMLYKQGKASILLGFEWNFMKKSGGNR